MLRKTKQLLVAIVLGVALFAAPVPVFAAEEAPAAGAASAEADADSASGTAAKNAVCDGLGLTGGSNGCQTPADGPSVNSIIRTVISFLSFIIGFIAVIMVIIGGLKYVTSNGDANSISSAKNTILYALIGLVIVALAQVIVRFVLNTV